MQSPTRASQVSGAALVKLLVFVVVFAGVLVAAWIFFLPLILTSTLSKRTGFDVTVQRLVFNPFAAEVHVEGLWLGNPATFSKRDYLTVRSFEARAPLKSFWSENPDIEYVRLDIERIAFLRNRAGTLNASLFYDRLFPSPVMAAPSPRPGEERRTSPTPDPALVADRPRPRAVSFRIQRLELRVDKVSTEDQMTASGGVKEFNVGIQQTFTDVTDPKQLLTPRLAKTLSPVATAINGLIPGAFGDVLNSAVEVPAPVDPKKKTAKPDPLKQISDTLEESKKP